MKKSILISIITLFLSACDLAGPGVIKCHDASHNGITMCYIVKPGSNEPDWWDPAPTPQPCEQKCDPSGQWCTCG